MFVAQAGPLQNHFLSSSRWGFQIAHARADGLEMVGVSNVNRAELEDPMGALVKAQSDNENVECDIHENLWIYIRP